MNKIDQIFNSIHDYVCDKNARALDPQEKKKTLYLKDLQYRSAKNIQDIRQNILLKVSALGALWFPFDENLALINWIHTTVGIGYAFFPVIRDNMTNDKKMRDFYTILGTWIALSALAYIAETSEINISAITNFLWWLYVIAWINSSDQPEKRKRWPRDDTLKQRLLDLMHPPPIAAKANSSEI